MKKLLIFLALCAVLATPAFAALEEDVAAQQEADLGTGEVEAEAPAVMDEVLGRDYGVMDSLDTDSALEKICAYAAGKLTDIVRGAAGNAALMLLIVTLCALGRSIFDTGGSLDFITLGGVLAIGAVAAGDVSSFIGLGRETIQALSDFSKVLLPSLATAAAAGGAVTSAAAKYAATALFMDVLLTVAQYVIVPLVYAYIALVVANAALDNASLEGAVGLMKWLCTSLLTVLVILFTAYLSVTGIISGTADAVTTRVAKTALSASLPVVGSILSDAASTIVAGAGVIRNAIGIFGMLAVVCVCLVPFLRLGVQYLLYKAVASLSAALPGGRLSQLISGLGTAFGIVLSLVGVGAAMLFVSAISSIQAVSA